MKFGPFILGGGLIPFRFFFGLKLGNLPSWFKKDYKKFKSLVKDSEFPISDSFPILSERGESAGTTNTHYFVQDLYMAQKIFENKPQKHVDIGSRVDGFVAHVASFRKIELLDIRKMESNIKNVYFKQADLMGSGDLPIDYCDSISSLHALEHFGLGRYGDPIDPDGHIKGFNNITKILRSGGRFYFSVPMGRQRIEFNAHRVFGLPYLLKLVSKDYDIISFSYIDDNSELYTDIDINEEQAQLSYGCDYGCALFELKKK